MTTHLRFCCTLRSSHFGHASVIGCMTQCLDGCLCLDIHTQDTERRAPFPIMAPLFSIRKTSNLVSLAPELMCEVLLYLPTTKDIYNFSLVLWATSCALYTRMGSPAESGHQQSTHPSRTSVNIGMCKGRRRLRSRSGRRVLLYGVRDPSSIADAPCLLQ